jgi:BASS family bile acid:Na+ symporter
MDLKQLVILGLQISIVFTLFGYGLKTTAADLLYVVKRPGLLARSLLSVFVIMTVIAFALVRLFDIREVVEISLVAAIALLAGVWRSVWDATGEGGILAIVVLVTAGLAIGHLLGGPERDESVVLGLSTACRHPAIAFAIASANYPEQRFGGAIILYLLVNALVGIPYVKWNRQRP